MTIAQGVNKQTRIKRQTVKGTLAGVTLGQIMRRKSSIFELAKDVYTTEDEITSTQQVKSLRHGVRLIKGSMDGILSPGTYSDPLSAILRRDYATVAPITAVSVTVAGSGPYTITRGAGSFLTDGFKIGMMTRLSVGGLSAANLNKNLFITGVSALVLNVIVANGSALVVEGPIAGCTISMPGKVTYVPDTGHTNIYHTVEEWYPDTAASEVNQDVKFTQADIALPGSGNATIKFDASGLQQTTGGAAYFTSPTGETATEVLTAAGGTLMVNGVAVAVVTDLSFSIDGNGAPAEGVVGTDIRPDVFVGKVSVKGKFTAYFEGGTIPALFVSETATSILSAIMAGSAANADFMTFAMSNVKLDSSSPDDTPTGMKRTYSFVALYNAAGGPALANTATSIQIQDSAA